MSRDYAVYAPEGAHLSRDELLRALGERGLSLDWEPDQIAAMIAERSGKDSELVGSLKPAAGGRGVHLSVQEAAPEDLIATYGERLEQHIRDRVVASRTVYLVAASTGEDRPLAGTVAEVLASLLSGAIHDSESREVRLP